MKKKLLLGIIAILSIVSLVAACSTEDVAEVAVEEVAVEEVVADMPEEDVDELVVAEDGTYSYYVNFLNYDGSVLQRSVYEEGKTPKYTGKTPTYADGAYTYTFKSWDKSFTPVTMTQTYRAVYTRVAIAKNESKQVVKDTCADVFGVAYAWQSGEWYYINVFQNGSAGCLGGTGDRVKPTGYDGEGWYHVDENWLIIEKCNKTSELSIKLGHDLIYYPEAVEDLVYNGTEQNLVYAGEGVAFNYSVEHEGMVSETGEVVPFAVDAGDYIVRYSIDGGTTWSEGINIAIAKRDITIASTTDSKTYDGTPLVRAEAGDAYVADGSLGTGDTFSVTMDASITNVGSVTNEIDDIVFFDIDSNDISYNYNVTKQEGTLTITPALVNLPVIADITYDGGDHDIEADYENSLYDFVDGTKQATDAGIYNVVVSLKDANNYAWNLDTPISSDQTITWKITKRNVTLTSNDQTKTYDGNPLVTAYPTVSGDGFVSGQDLDWASTASITEVGSTQATFVVNKVIDNHNDEADVTDNYNITCNYGTLTVEEAPTLCSNHSTHYKVTSIEPGQLNTMVNIQIYTWNGSAFIESGSTFTNAIYFLTTPEIGCYYADDSGYIVKCTNNHE